MDAKNTPPTTVKSSPPQTYQLDDLSKLPKALKPLTKEKRWVVWKWVLVKNKWTKPPFQPAAPSRFAKNNKPETWGTFAEAVACVKAGKADGIGFCLLDFNLGAEDLDDCRDHNGGALAPWAQRHVEECPAEAYVEVTVSGTGLRIIGLTKGEEMHGVFPVVDGPGKFELYRSCARYITVSGRALPGRGEKPLANIDAYLEQKEQEGKPKRGPGRPKGSTTKKELPEKFTGLLHAPNNGEGKECGGHPSRSEALFSFLKLSLRAGCDEDAIIAACLDPKYEGKGIYEHCVENGGEKYVKEQILHALNDEPAADADKKRLIRIRSGDLHLLTKATEKALVAAKCPVFFRGGRLIEPIWRWEKSEEENRDNLVISCLELNVTRLRYMTANHAAEFQRESDKGWKIVNPPHKVIEQLLDLGHWGFPTLKGFINSPTMRRDGSLVTAPGYDAKTELWYKPTAGVELPDIPKRPTKADGEAALELIEELLSGFPFKDDISRTVAIAALMTPVLRGAFDFAPLYLFSAPESGSGKTYLVKVISTLSTGRPPMVIAGTRNQEEMEKRLTAAAFEALPIVCLNNLSFDLQSDLLNQMITEDIVKLRLFGKNDKLIPCDCRGSTYFANGNNISIVGDLVRRTLESTIDSGLEIPEARTFAFDPVERVKADRGKYLAAVFTIARAYMEARSPAVEAATLAGFEGWTKIIRDALVWLGLPDPVITMKDARANDPERQALRLKIEAFKIRYGTEKEFAPADIVTLMEDREFVGGGVSVFKNKDLIEAFPGRRSGEVVPLPETAR